MNYQINIFENVRITRDSNQIEMLFVLIDDFRCHCYNRAIETKLFNRII